jgi:hypothetical protein
VVTNSASGDISGTVIQVGTVHGGIHVHSGNAPRNDYLNQVKAFAPAELVDRAAELTELADFCAADSTEGAYAWWQADAWTGKTALLSTFVLNPPENVQIVSFFITANLPFQSDRRAFVDNLIEQLDALLQTPPTQHLTESTREAHARGKLVEAAQHCRDRREQLVLVVDGLDEDRGVTGATNTYSIAAILPDPVPAGMRVIVSGRPNPPIPRDVPESHPLRHPEIVRRLTAYPNARARRDTMERDLASMAEGTSAGRDILGLVVAARGGLSTADLAELIDISPWHVEQHLLTAVGRSFVRVENELDTRRAPIYRLAHQQLDVMAHQLLGSRLEGYRRRLHQWADSYALRQWPTESPEYLLRGYFAMLTELADLPRMIACSTDVARHRRKFALTGGDGAALTEITSTQNLLLRQSPIDFVALSRLAVHRMHLYRRSSQLPATLPTGWARVGQFERAESMIESMSDSADHIDALLALANLCRGQGKIELQTQLLERAVDCIPGFNQFWSPRPVMSIAEAFARDRQHDRAKQIVDLIKSSVERAEALAVLARYAIEADDQERAEALSGEAETLVRSDESRLGGVPLSALAVVAAKRGNPVSAAGLLDEAESVLRAGAASTYEFDVGKVAYNAALARDCDRALRLVASIEDLDRRERWQRSVLWAIVDVDVRRAESIARDADNPGGLAERLSLVASAVVRQDIDRATRLTAEAVQIAEEIGEPARRLDAQVRAAVPMVEVGDIEPAMTIAHAYATSGWDAEAVLAVARALLRADELERGAELLVLTEKLARRRTHPSDERRSVLWIRTMADCRDFDRAEEYARSLSDREARSAAWAVIVEGALAAESLDRAEQALASIEEPIFQDRVRLDLVHARAASGAVAEAIALARQAHDLVHQGEALVCVARETDDGELLDEAERLAVMAGASGEQLYILLMVLEVAATWRDRVRVVHAMDVLQTIAQKVVGRPDDVEFPDRTVARRAIELCSTRPRTLTELVMRVRGARNFYDDHHSNFLNKVLPVRTTGFDTRHLSPDDALSAQLTREDWYYVAEQVVERDPEAYGAITAELDAIASADPAFDGLLP